VKRTISVATFVVILSGLIPKFASLLTTIPQCVLGGATISVFATITMTGVKMIASSNLTMRNSAVVGIAVALGIGIVQVPDAFALFPTWFISIFGKSSIVVTTLVAIALNLILPKDKPEEVVITNVKGQSKSM
jgi:xanthine/uracil permease